MSASELLAFRQPPRWQAPSDASPALACMLLAMDLCGSAEQLAAWWDWPAHRTARWHLTPEEQQRAVEALEHRRAALQRAA